MAGEKIRLAKDFRDLLRVFVAHEVRFLVVGAYALAVLGRPRATGDLECLGRADSQERRPHVRGARRFRCAIGDAAPVRPRSRGSGVSDRLAAAAYRRSDQHRRCHVRRGVVSTSPGGFRWRRGARDRPEGFPDQQASNRPAERPRRRRASFGAGSPAPEAATPNVTNGVVNVHGRTEALESPEPARRVRSCWNIAGMRAPDVTSPMIEPDTGAVVTQQREASVVHRTTRPQLTDRDG